VTLRFAKLNDSTTGTQGRPLGTGDRTQLATAWAGLFLAQELALLRRGYFQGSLGQAARCRGGDGLHLRKIDIEPRPVFSKGVLDDNFSPVLGESRDRLQFFGRQLPCCHDLAILEVRRIRRGEYPIAHRTFLALRRKGRPALAGATKLHLRLRSYPMYANL
jgi:hypothetical protein